MSLMDEINNQQSIRNNNAQKEKQKQELQKYLDPRGIIHSSYTGESWSTPFSLNAQSSDEPGKLIKEAMGILNESKFKSDIIYDPANITYESCSVQYIWCCHYQIEQFGKRELVEDFAHFYVFYKDFKSKLFHPERDQAKEYLDSYMRKYSEHKAKSNFSTRFVSGGRLYLFSDGYCFERSTDIICRISNQGGIDCFKKALANLVIDNR